ncbi:MAG: hypothetical protein JWR80_488 [Bradyrhizobium sp.]|nr:hypothetical protein [Bradyrhizobium sp.]
MRLGNRKQRALPGRFLDYGLLCQLILKRQGQASALKQIPELTSLALIPLLLLKTYVAV